MPGASIQAFGVSDEGPAEVQYVDGEYLWLLIDDTDEPVDLWNVSLEVLDMVPATTDGLIGLVWPTTLKASCERIPDRERADAATNARFAP